MKYLYSTGGSTPQRTILSQNVRRYRNHHDPWTSHAVAITPTSGYVVGFSGLLFGAITAELANHNQYNYITPFGFSNYTAFLAWYLGWSQVYLGNGSGPWFGEGWNPAGRSQHTDKVLVSEFADWFYAH